MSDTGVAAVERALSIVGAFGDDGNPLTLNELALRTGLYKSTILRLLVSLERFNCVLRLADGRYQLGPAFLHWGNIYQRSLKLEDHVVPALRRLVEQTGESASFYTRQGDQRLCLFRVDSAHSVRDHVHVGDLLPLDRGAAGRILREAGAAGTQAVAAAVVATLGERDPETGALAVPVFGAGNQVRGALSVSGPVGRFTDEMVKRSTEALLQAATLLTDRLGGDSGAFRAAAVDGRKGRAKR